jgi:SAM-dependent methyltransferase
MTHVVAADLSVAYSSPMSSDQRFSGDPEAAGDDRSAPGWQEADSQRFLDLGRIYTPRRDEIGTVVRDLIPAAIDDSFLGVDLGCGGGWLTEAILSHFAEARMLALDGSPAMLEAAARHLAPFGDRVMFRPFRLEDPSWIEASDEPLRCVVSSLVVHHLDGLGKQDLFRRVRERLEPGSALLICDLVEPTGPWGRHHMARAWDEEVERQSLELTGDLAAYEQFLADEWNLFDYPDPEVDKPSPLFEQLAWLREAGYEGVDAFWVRAGHAVYGGYKPEGAEA